MSEKIAIVILARGKYSKRIHKKPLAILKGRRLIEWTLDQAVFLDYPIWLYTDLPEIANIGRKYFVNVRDKKFDDESGIHRTGQELKEYNKEICADIIILLQVTSPYRDVNLMGEWINTFSDSEYDAGLAAYEIQDGYYYAEDKPVNYLRSLRRYNDNTNVKSIIYRETGSFYIFRKKQIENNHFLNTDKLKVFRDPYNIDINNHIDLILAEGMEHGNKNNT